MTYASRWARAWTLLAAVEVGFASLQWSPLVVVLDLIATGTGAAVCLLLYQDRRTPAAAGPESRRLAETARRSLTVSCCVVALCTLSMGSPPLALLAVLLAVVSSPVVVRLRTVSTRHGSLPARVGAPTRPGSADSSEAAHQRDDLLGTRVAQLDDDALFRLWRRTFWQLEGQPTVDELARLVALRQTCLDELARRNPDALRAWLESGARASGGPERFWRRRQDHGERGEDP
jgi:hypothetical protein